MILLGFWSMVLGQAPMNEWHAIVVDGRTEISSGNSSNTGARVVVDTVRVSRSNPAFPSGDSFGGLTEAVLVKDLAISIGNERVFVWRSAFADLVNPTRAVLVRDGANFMLRIGCRDGAEAFLVELQFDKTLVTRRRVFGALSPKQPSEDTRYRLRELGQW
jgi:hypothetical protein